MTSPTKHTEYANSHPNRAARATAQVGECATTECAVEAPAKVNLTLELLGTRPDGYHELRSIVVPISLWERVEVAPLSNGRITCRTRLDGIPFFDMASVPLGRNLAERATEALRRHAGHDLGASLSITKRVPVGAGLGGGSADAAGALLALDRLWGLGLPRGDLADIGATFASDVPAMTLGGAVLMEGRGERVCPLAIPSGAPPLWLVLAFDGKPIPTGDVYASCPDTTPAPPGLHEAMTEAVAHGDAEAAAPLLFNGLQSTVFARYPQTAALAAALRRAGALAALLSGSGGTVFGLARDEAHARAIAAALPTGPAAPWHAVVHTLPNPDPVPTP